MSLANLSRKYEQMRVAISIADQTLAELEDYLVLYLLKGNMGARTFLVEIARDRDELLRRCKRVPLQDQWERAPSTVHQSLQQTGEVKS